MLIDRNAIYSHEKYTYKNFIQLSDEELLMILSWRNHPDIRKCMNRSNLISEEEHLNFCHNLANRNDICYWMILKNENPIGVLCVVDINCYEKTCEPGFYLSPDVMGRGESIYVLSNYKDFLLNKLGFNGLVGHNYKDNVPSLTFTMFFGAKITGIKSINGRVCIQSYLSRDSFINGVGTDHIVLKYAKFMRTWDTDKFISEYHNAE